MRLQQQWSQEKWGPWARLAQQHEAEQLPRGAQIYAPDQPAEALLLLAKGQVGLYLQENEGRTLMLQVVEPGNLLGLVAAAGQGFYDTFAEVLSTATVYRVKWETLAHMMQSDGEMTLALLDALGHHRLHVSSRLDEVAFKSVPARLASLLLDMARVYDEQMVDLPRWSHRQFAEMINAYRETVTKVINQFRAASLLEINHKTIRLINRHGLEELAQGW